MVVGAGCHGRPKAYVGIFFTGATIAVALALAVAGPAGASPDQPPPPPQLPVAGVECNGALVPLDPRVSYRGGLGTLIYLEMLKAMCGPPAGGADREVRFGGADEPSFG